MTSTWPAVAGETLAWASRYAAGTASRGAVRAHSGPYRAAVVPAITGVELDLPRGLAAAVEDAVAEISRFDAELGAELAPFHSLLLRSESAASSRIENLTAAARAIGEAELLEQPARGNASLVVANTRAMRAAIDLSDALDAEAIRAMHAALLGASDPGSAGRWRTEQVWIGGGHLGPHQADFVPPRWESVPGAIEDLVSFLRRDDLSVLAQAAVAHAQFETIHPFTDGNGRTGRALVHALLRAKGVTRTVALPVSAGLLVGVDSYFDALTAYRTGDPAPIVERFADASFAAVAAGRALVTQLRAVRASWDDKITARRSSLAWRIADLLVGQPVVDARVVARHLGVAQQNVYGGLTALVDAGVLIESSARRNRVWRAPEVLAALDDFAAAGGRRRRVP